MSQMSTFQPRAPAELKSLSNSKFLTQAVAAHEIAHIANRDMLGIVLLQGVINSIVIAATLPLNDLRLLNGASRGRSWLVEIILWAVQAVAALVLTFFGSLVVKAFSRRREFRADAFAAILLGKESMVNALKTLSTDTARRYSFGADGLRLLQGIRASKVHQVFLHASAHRKAHRRTGRISLQEKLSTLEQSGPT